jgi:hypothetical protein
MGGLSQRNPLDEANTTCNISRNRGRRHGYYEGSDRSAGHSRRPAVRPRRGGCPACRPAVPGPNSQYRLGPDSMPQDGVPKGEIRGPFTLPSKVYPGTQHTYWVYVPAQYDPAVPASLMVFNDGQAFMNLEGDLRAPERPRQPHLPA